MEFTKEQVVDILTRVVEELREQRIPRQQFYNESGVSSGSFSQWNTGSRKPSMESIQKMANYLRQMLVDRPEARILFQTAKNAPASALLEAAAILARYQEESEKN